MTKLIKIFEEKLILNFNKTWETETYLTQNKKLSAPVLSLTTC